jgi:hypothetical protein
VRCGLGWYATPRHGSLLSELLIVVTLQCPNGGRRHASLLSELLIVLTLQFPNY